MHSERERKHAKEPRETTEKEEIEGSNRGTKKQIAPKRKETKKHKEIERPTKADNEQRKEQ